MTTHICAEHLSTCMFIEDSSIMTAHYYYLKGLTFHSASYFIILIVRVDDHGAQLGLHGARVLVLDHSTGE